MFTQSSIYYFVVIQKKHIICTQYQLDKCFPPIASTYEEKSFMWAGVYNYCTWCNWVVLFVSNTTIYELGEYEMNEFQYVNKILKAKLL